MIIAGVRCDVSTLSYEEQCEACENQIDNLAKIWRQRVTPRTQPQTGLHVWCLTIGLDAMSLEDSAHQASVVDVVSSTPSTALRILYTDHIGPEAFLDITWRLSAHNMDYFVGDTAEYDHVYLLSRYEVS